MFTEHCNSSTHLASAANMSYVQSMAMKTEEKSVVINKLIWYKVNILKYNKLVEDRHSDKDVLMLKITI